MTEREMYLKMAEWIRENGFTPIWQRGDCGCFQRAAGYSDTPGFRVRAPILHDVLGVETCAFPHLDRAGWTDGCTDDAVAACLIAADLAA